MNSLLPGRNRFISLKRIEVIRLSFNLLIFLFFIFYFIPCFSQQSIGRLQINAGPLLVAKNTKHTKAYRNGKLIKVFFRDSGYISKAKGRLLVLDSSHIQIIPFGKKEIVTINTGDISKIVTWKRRGKISTAIIGGTGLVSLGIALLFPDARQGVAQGNIIAFGALVYSIAILWYEAVAIPYLYISEAVGTRSQKKGYHFSIEKSNPLGQED